MCGISRAATLHHLQLEQLAMKTFCLLLLVQLLVALAQVQVFPEGEFVSYEGGGAAFQCLSFPIHAGQVTSVQWQVNGSLFESFGFQNANATLDRDLANGVGHLVFSNLTVEFNETLIHCVAHFSDRPPLNSTKATILLLQGALSAVNSLVLSPQNEAVLIDWEAPFTLDINHVDPDITYCVDVVSSTSSATLHSECGITETEFTYPLPPRSWPWCHDYNFTVTPVNIVGNGTSTDTQYCQNQADLISLMSSMSTFSPMSTISPSLISSSLNMPPLTIISPSQSQTTATEKQQSSGSPAGAIVVGTVVAVFILIIAILGILIVPILVRCRRKTKKIPLNDNTPSDMSQPLDTIHEIESTDPSAPSHPQVITYLRPLGNTELKELGTQLGLAHAHINRMAAESLCSTIVHSWLRKDDHVLTTSGEPSWESLANTLGEIGMTGVATNIRNDLLVDP